MSVKETEEENESQRNNECAEGSARTGRISEGMGK
jgi:hypothetical protein